MDNLFNTMNEISPMPLVSVTVITYNSGEYILDTLESIKTQTYKKIELIISDDCSSDNTIKVCKDWVQLNRDRFEDTKIITSNVNTGIPGNKNRSIISCKGEWIKSIAGDDILHEECVEKNLKFALKNNYNAIFSKTQVFNENFDRSNFLFIRPGEIDRKFYSTIIESDEQYKIMLNFNPIAAPTVFIKKNVLIDLGLFNLKYRFVEDYPMYLKVVKQGFKFAFLPEVTVYYRVHSRALSNSKVNLNFLESTNKFLLADVFPNCNIIRKISILWNYIIYRLLVILKTKYKISRVLFTIKNRFDPNYFNLFVMRNKKLI